MISIYCGKVEDLLSSFRPDFFDACLCDPPYGLKFMGKSWDHGVPSKAIWEQVKRTLKPGAPILAFGGTRTFHRLACAIEDAGFEIFDSILGSVWITGQGFPKSLDISKAIDKAAGAERTEGARIWSGGQRSGGIIRDSQDEVTTKRTIFDTPATDAARAWDGYGTALKPAWEPVVFARKPLSGTYAENCIEHGCGGLNIDGSRIAGPKPDTTRGAGGQHGRYSNLPAQGRIEDDGRGRYPANLILSHHPDCEATGTRKVKTGKFVGRNRNSEETGNKIYSARGKDTHDASYAGEDGFEEIAAWKCHPECPVAALDRQSGPRGSNSMVSGPPASTDRFLAGLGNNQHHDTRAAGGASRFFQQSAWAPGELLFHRAEAILAAWNPDLANIVGINSSQRNLRVASALSLAVTMASRGDMRVTAQSWTGLSTIATKSALRTLCVNVIALTLSLDAGQLPVRLHVEHTPIQNLANTAGIRGQTGTTTTTPNQQPSDGCVVAAIFESTQPTTDLGGVDSRRNEMFYCAKVSTRERNAGLPADLVCDHPTLKPIDLCRYLAALILPPARDNQHRNLLIPFAGAGSEIIGATIAGWESISAIEKEYPYIEQAWYRIKSRTGIEPVIFD